MNVKEYLKTAEIFTDEVMADFTFFDHTEIERAMLDHEIGKIYGRCGLSEETPQDVHNSVKYTLYKYEDKYNNLHTALTQTIDPTLLETLNEQANSTASGQAHSEGKNNIKHKERTYDDMSLSEVSEDGDDHSGDTNSSSTGLTTTESTRKRGMTYEDAEALIRLHMTSLYDIIIEDVANDLIVPVYIFED